MIKLNLKNVLAHLSNKKLEPQIQTETQQIYVLFNLEGIEFPLFVRVDEEPKILQLFMFMPCAISPKTFGELARLLHLLNKEIDMPGFGIDEKAGVVFFRWVIVTSSGEIQEELLDRCLVAIPQISKICYPAIASVGNDLITFEMALGQVKSILSNFTAG